MNQIGRYKGQKKQWEKPRLFNLDVEADTKTGAFGPTADFTNTTTATNTVTS